MLRSALFNSLVTLTKIVTVSVPSSTLRESRRPASRVRQASLGPGEVPLADRCTPSHTEAWFVQLCAEELLGGQTEDRSMDGSEEPSAAGLTQQTSQGRVPGKQCS